MKNLFLILFFSSIGIISCLSASAQENVPLPPLSQIKKVFNTPPPDILNENLNKAKQLQTEQAASQDTNLESDADIFQNPFTPQIPKTAKADIAVDQPRENQVPVVANSETPIPQFTVSGLIWHSSKPAAIVNGKIVAIGDQVSNWVIAEITKNGVRVTSENQSLWIKPVINPEGGAQNEVTNSYRGNQ